MQNQEGNLWSRTEYIFLFKIGGIVSQIGITQL